MKFTQLVNSIQHTHDALQQQAVKAVNRSLTVRNWLIGFYIVEFEQKGEDRAAYGSKLREKIAGEIRIKGLTAPELSRCRQFYKVYSGILGLMTQEFAHLSPEKILGLPTQELTLAPNAEEQAHYKAVLLNISYTHLAELIKIDDGHKRKYYELFALKTQPSVKELKRQIHSLSYERLGLSLNKPLAFEELKAKVHPAKATDLVKSHYLFDFLNLGSTALLGEEELETALLNHLQEFLLELGHGFCFEARQKRLLIGDEYFFIDLVLYHRILKCHVLIDLKVEQFTHNNAGQLNTYLNYYKKEVMEPGDNPPVGILMVTDKNTALVEYATAGMDNHLFVSKYLVQLPSKEELTQFVQNELKNL